MSHTCDSTVVKRRISQSELRNESGAIIRAVERGESFVVTRNGKEAGQLMPIHGREFVSAETATAAFASAPTVDAGQFRADIDALLDQSP